MQVEQEQFFSRWEWEKYATNKQAKDFYARDPLVTNLKEVRPFVVRPSVRLSVLLFSCKVIPLPPIISALGVLRPSSPVYHGARGVTDRCVPTRLRLNYGCA